MIEIIGMPLKVKKTLAAVIAERAKWETIKQIDSETKAEILSNNKFLEENTGKRITNAVADFLMSDEDFERYLKMVYAKNCEKGADSGGWDLTFWSIQKAVYEAEDKYIDAIAADIPAYTPEMVKTLKSSPELRKRFFEILDIDI